MDRSIEEPGTNSLSSVRPRSDIEEILESNLFDSIFYFIQDLSVADAFKWTTLTEANAVK